MQRAIKLLTAATLMVTASAAQAAYMFTEDFTSAAILTNNWADGDNGWVVAESGNNAAKTDGTAGSGRLYANTVFGTFSPEVYQTTPSLQQGNVTFDFLSGTNFTDLRLTISGTGGEAANIYIWTVSGDLAIYASGIGVDLVVGADSIYAINSDYATISVDFDVLAQQFTLNASSTDGDSVGPITFAFKTSVTDINEFRWKVISVDNGGEWNTTEISIMEVPEPASLALMGIGGLLMLRRRRN